MKNFIINNVGIKLLALVLAIVTWSYIVLELQKGSVQEGEALQSIIPYNLVSKNIPIKINLAGEARKGYIILNDKIVTEPSTCVMIGPKVILEKISSVQTEPIDLSGYTRTFTKDVSIIPPLKGFTIKEKFVSVTVPVLKVE